MKEPSVSQLKQRQPFLAGLLALLGPFGLGQIYNGEARKGLMFWLIGVFFLLSIRLIGAMDSLPGFVVTFILGTGLFLFTLVDAVRTAKQKREITLKWYNRWYLYVIVILAVMLFRGDFIKSRIIGYEAFKIPAGSMIPTLRVGDYILVTRTYYESNSPQRGEIVVFSRPEDPDTNLVKRIIGLPGDVVELRGTQLFINSEPYPEAYARYVYGGIEQGSFGPVTVPGGHLFLLGDNRDNSRDSRFWSVPFLPIDRLKGKVLYIYFSLDDLKRIGTNPG